LGTISLGAGVAVFWWGGFITVSGLLSEGAMAGAAVFCAAVSASIGF
jgi:hypothetical protein